MQPAYDFRLTAQQRIEGNVEPEGFEPRTDLHQILDQESFGTADIEHPHSRLQLEVRNDILRYRNPSAVVFVAAVAILARTIEIHLAVLLGDGYDDRVFCILALLNVALDLGQSAEQIEFRHQAFAVVL